MTTQPIAAAQPAVHTNGAVRRLMLRSFQSPGDILVLTAAVRDLHLAHAGKFQTDIRTSADALWENNPYITRLNEKEPGVEAIECHYPLIHQANSRPYHFIHAYAQFLEQRLGVSIPLTKFAGDIHLSADEKRRPLPFQELGLKEGFWIVMAGGKNDFTAKWWDPAGYQAVIDHFEGRIQFVQCGEAGHWHPRLKGAVDLVGRTSTRDFIVLMHHAAGVLCPVTFAMHLAAAVEARPGKPRRPCVVVAGAREPAHWEQYPGHQFLHTLGSLPCCASDPCWRSRCQLVGDGDEKDRREVCERPIQLSSDLRIPECMAIITPEDVIRAIERYAAVPRGRHTENGLRSHLQGAGVVAAGESTLKDSPPTANDAKPDGFPDTATPTDAGCVDAVEAADPSTSVLIDFRHGLGDAVQLTTVLLHLRHYHPDWRIDVAAGVGKLPAAGPTTAGSNPATSKLSQRPLYDRFLVRDRDAIDRGAYQHVFDLAWDECPTCLADSPSTKAEHCLRTTFKLAPLKELCRYELTVNAEAWSAAKGYLEGVCGPGAGRDGRYPAVVLHYQGNTSSDRKNLSHDLARRVCDIVLDAGYVPVILDWDGRTPLADGARIFNPGTDSPLWGRTGTGDCEAIAALIAQSSLFIGVDSGPLHVAGATVLRSLLAPQTAAASPHLKPSGLQSQTPVIAAWTGHHPLHYFGLAEHVTHLVHEHHAATLRGNRQAAEQFFHQHYHHHIYKRLDDELPNVVTERLSGCVDGLIRRNRFWVRRDNVDQDLVIVCDIAEDDSYRMAELPAGGAVVVDVGAHIGVFSRAFKERHPSARVVAVECCPENIAALEKNVGDFAAIVPAALTYEPDVALLNAVFPGCVSTGGSTVISRADMDRLTQSGDSTDGYWLDQRLLPTVTLEQIMADNHLARIDVLKLDCEGSEYSILENTTSLGSIGAIVGEYHGRERFMEMVASRFADWDLRIIRDGDPGTFWLLRPLSADYLRTPPADVAEFWGRFLTIVHPVDLPLPERWQRYYCELFTLAAELQPRRVCEIGVRAGYSAFAILSANSNAVMLGVDADVDEATHKSPSGLWWHAERILAPFNYQLLLADSHALKRLPRCDLVYIDGEHTLEGCLADLRLAERSTDCILADDYDSIPEIREACQRFAAERTDFTQRYIDNGLTGFLLFQRSPAGRPSD